MTRRTAPLQAELGRRRPILPAAPATTGQDPSQDHRDRVVLAATGIAWWVLLLAAFAVMPEAADPAAAEELGLVDQLLGLVQVAALATVVLTLMSGSRGAAGTAMVVGGAIFLASSIGCVASGHHAFGTWWYGQAAALSGMIAAGGVALRGALRRR